MPGNITFYGSKEKCMKVNEFMKQVQQHNIDYNIIEAGLHHQNPVEGAIQELIRKWYIIMIKKRVPRKFCYYGLM